ncbi:MAG TPA: hypothetical protein VIU61_11395 [Kofleriaceae bacterium]
MRNSSKRISTSPPVDDDILAASSAGWKAVALPVAEPVRDEIAPLDKKRASRSSKQMAAFVQSSQAAETTEPVSLAAHAALKQNKQKKSKAPLFAVASLGLAAAAGAAIYVTTQNTPVEQAPAIAASANGSTEPVAKVTPVPGVATATPIEQAPAAPAPEAAAAAGPAADTVVASAETSDEKLAAGAKDRDSESSSKSSRGKAKRSRDEQVVAKTESKKPDVSKTRTLPTGSGAAVVKPTGKVEKNEKNEEPSFEELLKEANIPDNKKLDDKPKLEKKSLSSADIKKGMSSVAAKAQGCYNGTQGTAAVKLVVDPSGKVSKVSVTGAFAGTPVAACVEKAVKAAAFPPWDGGPQSFGYSYLLSE